MGLILDGTTGISASGNITGGNIVVTNNFLPTDIIASGNIAGGNILTAGIISSTGNITGGNLSGTLVTGTLTTNAQPNVTSLGLLTSLSVAGFTISGNTIVGAGSTVTIDPGGSGGNDGLVVITGNLQVTGTTTTINSNTVAINDLVFNVANNAASASQATGGGYGVGPSDGEYATLLFNSATTLWDASIGISAGGIVTTAANVIGGNVLTSGLISATGQITGSQFNGSGAGLTSIPAANVIGTLSVNTTGYAATISANAQPNITSVGDLTSLNVIGNISATGLIRVVGDITTTAGQFNGSGAGLTGIPAANVVGTLSVNTLGSAATAGSAGSAATATTAATVTTNAQPNITSVGTLSSVNVTGNIGSGNILTGGLISATGTATASQFNGSGAGLTSIPAANVTGTLSVNTTGYAATVSTAAQPNITSVGTLSTLDVTANVTGGNITTTGLLSATGNVTGGNINTSGLITATGNITGGNVLTAGIMLATGNATGGNINTAGLVTATGNVVGGNFNTAGLVTATGNVTGGNINTAGLVTATGNVVGGNVLTAGVVSATGNITTDGFFVGIFRGSISGNITAPGANTQVIYNNQGNAAGSSGFTFDQSTNALVASGNITGGNILTAGLINSTGNITGGNLSGTAITGTLSTAAQPNVTSLGLLTSLSAAGFTISANTIVSSGATMTLDPNTSGGSDGLVVINGNLQVNGTTTTINSNTVSINDLVFNVANNAASSSQATGGGIGVGPAGAEYATLLFNNGSTLWDTSIGISVGGIVKTAANITGGNLITSGLISATSTVTGSQFNGSGAGLTSIPAANVTGTLSVNTTGYAATVSTAAQPNITSVGTLSSLAVTANVTGGNLLTGGLISAGGTITGSQFIGSGSGLTSIPATSISGTFNSLLTGGQVSAVGNIIGSQFNGSGAGLTSIPAANVTGTLSVNTTGYAATVSTAAQPNITSVGTLSSVYVSGAISAGGGVVNTAGNGVSNIGSSSAYFNTVFAKATSAQYADLAEMYAADAHYIPGTVIEFGGDKEVTTSTASHSTRVAGIVSTNPSYLMNSTLSGDHPVQVALIGRVPCRVVGTIAKGDRIVASHLPGVATVLNADLYIPGCIIGKALEDYNSESEGVIEVAVGRT
jgi:hypothetical protein